MRMTEFRMLGFGNTALTASPGEEWEGRERMLRFLGPFPTEAGFRKETLLLAKQKYHLMSFGFTEPV